MRLVPCRYRLETPLNALARYFAQDFQNDESLGRTNIYKRDPTWNAVISGSANLQLPTQDWLMRIVSQLLPQRVRHQLRLSFDSLYSTPLPDKITMGVLSQ